MTKQFISPDFVASIIGEHRNEFITIKFIKRTDGTERVITGRTGVSKYTNKVGMSYTPHEKALVVLFDVSMASKLPVAERSKAYRCVPVDSVLEIRAGGKFYDHTYVK